MNGRTTRLAASIIAAGALALPLTAQAHVYGGAGVQVGGGISAGVNVQAGYAQPQPVYAQPQAVVVQQPVYAQPQPVYVQQQPVYQQPRYVVQSGPRFRYGIDVGGGWFFGGGLRGGSITGSLRLGWQLNDRLAIYYQGDLPIGFASNAAGDSSAAIMLGTGILGEWTFGDVFSLAIGPSVDYSASTSTVCSSSSTTTNCRVVFFGVQTRAAVSLLTSSSGENTRRRALRIGLSSHTAFQEEVFQFFDLHLGYEWF